MQLGSLNFHSTLFFVLCSQLLATHHDILDKEKQRSNLIKEQ